MDRRTFVTPLALAVAGVFPCLVLSPLAGMSLSVGINILLLLHVQELSIRRKLEVPPPSSTSLPDGVLKVFPKRILDAPLIPNYMNAADRDALSPLPSLAPLPPLPCAVPVAPALEDPERQQLATGAMVLRPAKQVGGRSGSTADARRQEGLAAQRIDVPARVVWETLLDFDAWPKMVDNVAAAKVYEHEGNDIKVHVTLSVGFMRISTYVHHVLDEEAGTLSWSLDPSRSSDLLSNVGYWLVVPDDDELGPASSCTVYYSASVRLKAWAPSWLDSFIAVQGLPRAIGWIKRAAERRYASAGADTFSRSGRIQSAPNLAAMQQEAALRESFSSGREPLRDSLHSSRPHSPHRHSSIARSPLARSTESLRASQSAPPAHEARGSYHRPSAASLALLGLAAPPAWPSLDAPRQTVRLSTQLPPQQQSPPMAPKSTAEAPPRGEPEQPDDGRPAPLAPKQQPPPQQVQPLPQQQKGEVTADDLSEVPLADESTNGNGHPPIDGLQHQSTRGSGERPAATNNGPRSRRLEHRFISAAQPMPRYRA